MENRKKLEIFIILLLIIAAGFAVWMKVSMTSRAEKEQALLAELRAVRTAVQTYLIINKTFPFDLKTLAKEQYTFDGKQAPYLKGIKLDNENYPISVFGKKFEYDAKTGWVSAGDEGYLGW